MKKYQILFTLIFVLISMLWFYLDALSLKKTRAVYIQDLNVSMVSFADLLAIDQKAIHHSTHKLWGMTISRALKERELLRQAVAALKEPKEDETVQKYEKVNVIHRTICIEGACWLFVGKVEIGDLKSITLLSKDNKAELKTYNIGDYLSKKTKIVDIEGDTMLVVNEDRMDYFKLKLFDINLLQYKPKVTKEHNE